MAEMTERQTAAERREAVLEAARGCFARGGLHGTSTDDIAKAAGISQPYLFRLFGTKKELFIASVERCFDDTVELFRQAAGELRGADALDAMGLAYVGMVTNDRNRLMNQLHAYAACDDPDVRDAVRHGYASLFRYVEAVAGLEPEIISRWFATGKLLNVVAALGLLDSREPWAQRLVAGCVGSERADLLRAQKA